MSEHSPVYRWQAASGAIAGALAAGALTAGSSVWTLDGMRSIEIAERFLSGTPVPIDLCPNEAVPVAVGLASQSAPLLVDTTTVVLVDAVQAGLEHSGRREVPDPLLAKAAELAREYRFVDAVDATCGDRLLAVFVGAFAGLEGGLGAVPARLVSNLSDPDGRRGRRYLCSLTNRLLGLETPNRYDPRNRRGPKEVLPGLWLSNVHGLTRFTSEHPDGLILSLCDEEGRIANHPHHLTFHLEDAPRTDANPSLEFVVDEILTEIAAARSSGQPVLVHCRHGASRTGFVLRLVLIDELGVSADDALTEALCLWPHTSSWNPDWTREVGRRAGFRKQLGRG